MIIDPQQLPEDTPTLHKIIIKLLTENESLKDTLIRMRHARFGASSEKLNDKQIQLFAELFADEFDLLPDAVKEDDTDASGHDSTVDRNPPKRKPRRKPLPSHLRRVEVHLDLSDDELGCPCCQGMLHRIGEDRSEKLAYIPAQYWVNVIIRPKYACRDCEDAVYQKPVPLTSNPKGLFAASLQAQIVVSKYVDHQPLHRQHRIMSRSGIKLPVSTLSDSCKQVAGQLKPLVELLRLQIVQSQHIFTDDTILPRNNGPGSEKGRTNQSRLWVYLGGSRNGPTSAYYHYTPTRSSEGPRDVLEDFEGYLQADAYPGYKKFYRKQGQGDEAVIFEVACMAHARRKFKEATLGLAPESAGLAYQALLMIKQLYAIEREIRAGSDEERQSVRQLRAAPIMAEFKQWLDKTVHRVARKSQLYEAIQYTLNQWSGLQTYISHGFLEIDNNAAERSMKPIALGRKNYLFVGSDKGGETASILYSILETCKLNQVEPLAYLTDVLTRLPITSESELKSLLPYNWLPSQQASAEAA